MIDQKIIERIQKLLALAESSNENEATLAMARAQNLITRYNLSMAEVAGKSKEEISEGEPFFKSHNTSLWKERLAGILAKLNGCYYFTRTYGYKSDREIQFCLVGTETNRKLVNYFFHSIVSQTERLCKIKLPRGGGKTWGNEFKLGAVSTIHTRLLNAQKEAVSEHIAENEQITANIVSETKISSAIVLLNQEYSNAESWARNQIHGLRPKKITYQSKTNFSAYAEGKQAGYQIALNKPLTA